ncbi:(Fe-S)-binding protein [Bacillus sp. FJAT-47783]|uniref:(Fe-S)-binding protein n=1 Tax=Bacillus sp. FJAT-47783 TaxID=2922712 RepID=UPI001FABDF2A|nr:(Fe-S)-binding protein [Bacillus sp. FJAT-47783]
MTKTIEKEIQQQFQERLNDDELLNCMRCGFCLPSCPTYIETGGNEVHSPRGRIALMKAVKDGLIEPDEEVEKSLNMCLGCRACEPVCPSGVNYGHLLEEVRDIISQKKKQSMPVKVLRRVVFKELFPHPNRMNRAVSLLGIYQRSGLQKAVRNLKLLNVLPEHMRTMEKVLPSIPPAKERKKHPDKIQTKNKPLKRVAFFTGCLMDTMFRETNNATIKLLQLAGCEIVIPPSQNCCGALHGHSGEKELAKDLAKQNIEAFENLQVDYIILNAGGCGAFLCEYDHLLGNDPEWAERAKRFAEKIKDISEVLVEVDFHNRYRLELNDQVVTYQDSCHLRNVMKTAQAPRTLLKAINGVDFREMKEADRCCGSAGVYNIVQPEMSMQILDQKMKHVKDTKATTIVTANPGCLLQMKLGIEREGQKHVRAVHIVDLLLEAVKTNEQLDPSHM